LSAQKKSTVRLTIRVSQADAELITTRAAALRVPLSDYGASLLLVGLAKNQAQASEHLVLPLIQSVVRGELQRFLEVLREESVRTYAEAGTARRMLQVLMAQSGQDRESILATESANWNATLEELKRDGKGIRKWLREQGQLVATSSGPS
jgi:hypothetical protein